MLEGASGLGVRLGLSEYQRDFGTRFAASGGYASWKLERRQSFREPGNPSWDALVEHGWRESLRIVESQRDEFAEEVREADQLGVELLRIRVVEVPLTPYLQWELHSLVVRAECGEQIRVVGSDQVASLESEAPLPEILTVGQETVYEIVYTDGGVLAGAVRYEDEAVALRCKKIFRELFHRGEDIGRFFQREVVALPPPVLEFSDVCQSR
ncbi:hypothetical protein OU415_06925 [Saccharopolyspora sp. WRP15-2]|uniref:DUF6879 domain-containing protein n=1 Tax=Saccharopolyspora oryzae TaxID=2997343 RepID=A0ABT4UTX0_9PSEU|nr:DUF6879 family protein [Saccharopolyspora oryzae]MDA3625161.1 hypothetical protein [Saccharopolyspora oryzae]